MPGSTDDDGIRQFDATDDETVTTYTVVTNGNFIIDGGDGDDTMEDLLGEATALLDGEADNDTLISRGGRDILHGGNDFEYRACEDNIGGGAADSAGNTDCDPYVDNPDICGTFDDSGWIASARCCACGGGSGE